MNRIARYLREKGKARKIEKLFQNGASLLSAPLEISLERCSFCNANIADKPFRAWSHPKALHEAVICNDCVKTLAVFAKFTDNHALWFKEPLDYSPLRQQLLKKLSIEDGDTKLKDAVINLTIRWLQRSSAILGGVDDLNKQDWDRDSRTGVPFATPRLAILGSPVITTNLLLIAALEIGIVCVQAEASDVESGKAYNDFVERKAAHVPNWAEHGMLITDRYVEANANCGVVFALTDANDCPLGFETIEPI